MNNIPQNCCYLQAGFDFKKILIEGHTEEKVGCDTLRPASQETLEAMDKKLPIKTYMSLVAHSLCGNCPLRIEGKCLPDFNVQPESNEVFVFPNPSDNTPAYSPDRIQQLRWLRTGQLPPENPKKTPGYNGINTYLN